jgi:RluA family pseudouridine synthase
MISIGALTKPAIKAEGDHDSHFQLDEFQTLMFDAQALIHWHDDQIAVIDKPPNLRSIADGYNPSLPHLRTVLEPLLGRLWIVHRLDKDTSGLLVLARNADAHRALNQQFSDGTVMKRYHTLVEGVPDWKQMSVNLPLLVDGDRHHRTVVNHERGVVASTDFNRIFTALDLALIEAIPHTGRTHQIRAHLAAIGHPILGDKLYGSRQSIQGLDQMALQAVYLGFLHPMNNDPISFELPTRQAFITPFRV